MHPIRYGHNLNCNEFPENFDNVRSDDKVQNFRIQFDNIPFPTHMYQQFFIIVLLRIPYMNINSMNPYLKKIRN